MAPRAAPPPRQLPAHDRRLSFLFIAAVCASLSLLAACASVPDVDHLVDGAASSTAKPVIMGSRGPLTQAQSKALLARMVSEPGEAGMLQRHLAIEQAVAENPLIAGNRTRLLRDGEESFRAVFAAIQGAKTYVNLEYYILEDVESDGVMLSDLLIAKRQAGVAVNIIYDSFGSSSTPVEFFDRLKQAGVNVVEFNPINPFDAKVDYSLNRRGHRKILTVDDTIGIVGGVNLSTTYQSIKLGKSGSGGDESTPEQPWRDTVLQIEGPAVAQLQGLFFDHWDQQQGPPLARAESTPAIPARGTEVIRIIGSTPDHAVPRFYVTLLSAIRNAEKSITMTAAYFVPTDREKVDLMDAARRGVDVRLLLGAHSDSQWTVAAAHSHYSDLLKAGVKIYELQGSLLHSKTVTVDGVWSIIGSSNIDHRSIMFNDEVDAVVLGSETAQAMERMFNDDLADARRIDPATWSDRPILQKVKEVLSRLWQELL